MHHDPLSAAIARIERTLGAPEIVSKLAQLKRGDLTAIIMAVAKERVGRIDGLALGRVWASDPFVAPSPVDPRAAIALDLVLYDLAKAFTPLELSPLVPLGACGALAPVDQNRIEVTGRGREVMSDPSNALALEAARRRVGRPHRVDLCASHRVVRTPPVPDVPGFAQHFRLFALVSAFRGSPYEALHDHLAVHLGLLAHVGASAPKLTLVDRSGTKLDALREMAAPFAIEKVFTTEREGARTYYPTISFTLEVTIGGASMFVADGGEVDWTARILSDRKERCLISGIGTQRILSV